MHLILTQLWQTFVITAGVSIFAEVLFSDNPGRAKRLSLIASIGVIIILHVLGVTA